MTDTQKLAQEIDEGRALIRAVLAGHPVDGDAYRRLDNTLQQARDALPVWVPVEDKLPEPKQDVVYYFEFVGSWPGRYLGDGTSNVFGGKFGFLTDDVTHWMPLPTPPETD